MRGNETPAGTAGRRPLGTPETTFETPAGKPEIVMTRTFDAPRHLVFEAMTRAEHLARWWGPRALTLTVCQLHVREGGEYRFVQRAPDGSEHPFRGTYREVSPPGRLVFTQRYDVPPYADRETVVTVVLREEGGRTAVTLTQTFSSLADRDGMVATGARSGAVESFERLGELLATGIAAGPTPPRPELRLTRTFDAPRRLVFEAWTKAEHVARWFAPRPLTISRCELDFRPGGVFNFAMRMPDGHEFPSEGRFVDIVPLERIAFEGTIHEGNRVRTVVTFAGEGKRTTLTVLQTYSVESDATRGAPMGWSATLDQLAEHIARA